MSWLLSLWTVFVAVVFFGVVVWAMSRRRKAEFDAAAQIPLDDDKDEKPAADSTGDHRHG
ncbi:MAG: CcoQ/FixQ family Cbb3-type cytochrome c oxidase assembly chaperone [Gammaproteobacteria bacterium]